MPRYRKHIWAGDVYECEEYYSPRAIGKKYNRGQNELLTSEEQKERNLKLARRKLSRLINANFKQGDLFITLTYRNRLSREEIKRELRNFLSRLRRWRKKKGFSAIKYIVVTESESGREHHHLLVNAMDITLKEMTKLWGNGRVMISQLEPGGDYTGLARYITKENVKEYEKRWSTSRNLVQPRVVVKKINSANPKKKPKPPKGFSFISLPLSRLFTLILCNLYRSFYLFFSYLLKLKLYLDSQKVSLIGFSGRLGFFCSPLHMSPMQ